MLVLSRKTQEKIRIGDSIVVTILSVKGNSVRVGIEAPRSVRIVRSELEPLSESPAQSSDKSVAAAPAAPVPAPMEMAEEADEIAGLCSPGHFPATQNRISGMSAPMTQFVARPR